MNSKMKKNTLTTKIIIFWLPMIFLGVSLLVSTAFKLSTSERSLSSYLNSEVLIVREMEKSLADGFRQVVKRLYGNAEINGYEDLFTPELLESIGLTLKNSKPIKSSCTPQEIKKLNDLAVAHVWYSVFAFQPEKYKWSKDGYIQPPLARTYPVAILFQELKPGSKSIHVVDCGRSIFIINEPIEGLGGK